MDLSRYAPEDQDDAYVTFYDTLNGLRQTEKVDVYVTGSNFKTLSRDIDMNFADRGTQIRVRPFFFCEYCDAVKPVDKGEALSKYLIWAACLWPLLKRMIDAGRVTLRICFPKSISRIFANATD